MAMVGTHHQSSTSPGHRRFRLCIHRIREFDTAHRLEDISSRVTRTARSLYRCFLSCKDAFPTPDLQDDLAEGVWGEACAREGTHPNLLRRDGEVLGPFLLHAARINSDLQFVYDSLRFITDLKMNIMHAVESFYGFDTSQASESIGRNSSRAQALLTKMRFVYRVRLNSASI